MTYIYNLIAEIRRMPYAADKELVPVLRKTVFDYDLKNASTKESAPLSELCNETLTRLANQLIENQSIASVYKEFDTLCGGFYPGELLVIVGRLAMGKNRLLVDLILNFSITQPVFFFSFDLSSILLSNRFLAALSKMDVSRILQRNLDTEEDKLLKSLQENITGHHIYVNVIGYNSVSPMKALVLEHIHKHEIKMVISDYLQLMSSSHYRNNRQLEISYICRELKNMAKEQKICINVVSRLNHAVESPGGSKRTNTSDLCESIAIEQDAEKVILIYRPEYYHIHDDFDGNSTEGIMELIVAKNRNGGLGIEKLIRDNAFTSFIDFDERTDNFKISLLRLNYLFNLSDYRNINQLS